MISAVHLGAISFVRRSKSSNVLDHNRYCLMASYGGRRRAYTPGDIDFLAAYVGQEDAWYIIPVAALRQRVTIHLYPHMNGTGQFEHFREAWQLLLAPPEL